MSRFVNKIINGEEEEEELLNAVSGEQVADAIWKRDLVRLKMLISVGANVNGKTGWLINDWDSVNISLLSLALLQLCSKDMVELLINSGADINATDPVIGGPLNVACNYVRSNYSLLMTNLLCCRGAFVDESILINALHSACSSTSNIHVLLKHNADRFISSDYWCRKKIPLITLLVHYFILNVAPIMLQFKVSAYVFLWIINHLPHVSTVPDRYKIEHIQKVYNSCKMILAAPRLSPIK